MVLRILTRCSVLSFSGLSCDACLNRPIIAATRFLTTTTTEVTTSTTIDAVSAKQETQQNLELMPAPKPRFGKKELMKLRKKTGFSMSRCRKALLKHDLDLEAALKYLRQQLEIEEAAVAPEEDKPTSTEEEIAKKKKKTKLKGGVIVARISKDAAMLLELNCQSVTLTRNEDFHSLVDSVANVVFENAESIVGESRLRSSGATRDIDVEGVGVIVKSTLLASDIFSLKSTHPGEKRLEIGKGAALPAGAASTPSSVKKLFSEGKAKLGEALSARRCVVFAARPTMTIDDESKSPVEITVSPPPSASTPPPPPRPPRIHFGFYVHPSSVRGADGRPLNGQYGAVVAFAKIGAAINERHFNIAEVGRKLAQHVVGMNPSSLEGGGKGGRGEGEDPTFHGVESRLLEQEFLSDPSLLIKEYLFINGVKMIDFARFESCKR